LLVIDPFKNCDQADERHENNACGKFMSPETGLVQPRGAVYCLIGMAGMAGMAQADVLPCSSGEG
jgi:hypothetical protein